MFLDLTYKKIVSLIAIVILVGGTALATSFFVQQTHAEDGIMQYFKRTEAGLAYWFFFKTPFRDQQGLAAVALAQEAQSADAPLATDTAASVPVLLYHGEGPATTTMPTGVFVDQMRALKAAGWQTITMEQFQAFMKGDAPVPDKSFLLTFDDGRVDTFYSVDPVLKDLGYTGVMFVVTGFSMPNNGDTPMNYPAASRSLSRFAHIGGVSRSFALTGLKTEGFQTFLQGSP